MSTRHEPFVILASQSIDGGLGAEDRRALDEHLRTCSDCRKLGMDLAAEAETLRVRPRAQVPAGMYGRVSTTWASPAARMPVPIGALAILIILLLMASLLAAFGFGTRRLDLSVAEPSPSILTARPSMDPKRLRSTILAWSAVHGRPSGSVTVIGRQGEYTVVSLDGTDTADAPVGRIGEASHAFVATAVLVLADCSGDPSLDPGGPPDTWGRESCVYPIEADSLRLEDAISRWYPASAIGDRTVRQLLAGTSGIAAVAPTIGALADRIGAAPGGPWDRDGLLAGVLSAPVRYAAGARRAPVDSEYLLLEAILERATGMETPAWLDMATLSHVGLHRTAIGAGGGVAVTPGRLASGGTLADLDPTLLNLLGASGGIATDSVDLAKLASVAWGSAEILSIEALREASDAANGHRAPLGGLGLCPCTGDQRSVIALTGHAIAWSSLAAYDLDAQAAIAAVIAADIDDADLRQLLDLLVAEDRS